MKGGFNRKAQRLKRRGFLNAFGPQKKGQQEGLKKEKGWGKKILPPI